MKLNQIYLFIYLLYECVLPLPPFKPATSLPPLSGGVVAWNEMGVDVRLLVFFVDNSKLVVMHAVTYAETPFRLLVSVSFPVRFLRSSSSSSSGVRTKYVIGGKVLMAGGRAAALFSAKGREKDGGEGGGRVNCMYKNASL